MIKLKDYSLYDDKRVVKIKDKVKVLPDWGVKAKPVGIFGKPCCK